MGNVQGIELTTDFVRDLHVSTIASLEDLSRDPLLWQGIDVLFLSARDYPEELLSSLKQWVQSGGAGGVSESTGGRIFATVAYQGIAGALRGDGPYPRLKSSGQLRGRTQPPADRGPDDSPHHAGTGQDPGGRALRARCHTEPLGIRTCHDGGRQLE